MLFSHSYGLACLVFVARFLGLGYGLDSGRTGLGFGLVLGLDSVSTIDHWTLIYIFILHSRVDLAASGRLGSHIHHLMTTVSCIYTLLIICISL